MNEGPVLAGDRLWKALSRRSGPFFLIAGPCVIENPRHPAQVAARLKEITSALGIPFVFKASYDKANRSSLRSYRGPGIDEGLEILAGVRARHGVPILTDVHEVAQVAKAAQVADVLQIPAFLCRQTDLVVEAARTGRIVNVKKGQFMAPWDMKGPLEKAAATGNRKVMVTERGFSLATTTWSWTCARSPRCAPSAFRWSSTSPTASSGRVASATGPMATGTSSIRWRRRASPPACTGSSWRSTRTRPAPSPTAPTPTGWAP